ncbi:MAG: DUF4956 domain-containing protein [Clostridia bacterium]|nr:DUF4956 domain-containing protein [Clostridia bacterium]
MLNALFQPLFTTSFTLSNYLICTAVALVLGVITAAAASFRTTASRSFLLSLVLLPPIVQTVIMLVNGSIGTGIAVMGAFSLVRFRSMPGSAREIATIFLSMAIGLATATGYLGIAVLLTLILSAVLVIAALPVFAPKQVRQLVITVPESLNYAHAFDDVFAKYAKNVRLISVKTTHMGSLFKLTYTLSIADTEKEKELIDALRCRNGNLEIALGVAAGAEGELL